MKTNLSFWKVVATNFEPDRRQHNKKDFITIAFSPGNAVDEELIDLLIFKQFMFRVVGWLVV